MHIILGILGTIVSILFLLDRMGIDIGGLNPWSWRRRRAWAKKYEGDPIYAIEDPMQVAAILIIGAARIEGDLNAEQKTTILELFERKFSLDPKPANELLGSSAFLLGAPQVIGTQLRGVADKHAATFSREQAESMIEMAEQVAATGGGPSAAQREYLDGIRAQFLKPEQEGTWATR